VFLLLYSRLQAGNNIGLNFRQIWWATGVNVGYLKSRLGIWTRWKYLSRRAVSSKSGRALYRYTLAKRGIHFIEDIIPPNAAQEMIKEIEDWQTTRE
jgi:hypothetical protein